jgi:chemotaxis protein MotB
MSNQVDSTTVNRTAAYKTLGSRLIEGPENAESDSNWIVSYADMMTLLVSFFAIMFSLSKMDTHKFDQMREAIAHQMGKPLELPFEDLDQDLKKIVSYQKLSEKIKIDRDSDGLRIIFKGAILFDEGSARVHPDFEKPLQQITEALASNAVPYPIFVEGHTDNHPISTALYPSNWELSAARASLVVRMLEARGFPKHLLDAQGFGDSRPLLPNQDAAGHDIPENQSQNRRVVIRVSRDLNEGRKYETPATAAPSVNAPPVTAPSAITPH